MNAHRKAMMLFLLVLVACTGKEALTAPKAKDMPIAAPKPGPVNGPQAVALVPIESAMVRTIVDRFRVLKTPTYDGSGQATHPTAVEGCEDLFNGYRLVLGFTPYKDSDGGYENLSFLVGNTDTLLSVPLGITNPVVKAFAGGINSDPDAYCDKSAHKLYTINRVATKDSLNILKLIVYDGVSFDSSTVILKVKSHDAVSPSLAVRPGYAPRIYYVTAGPEGCNTKATSVRYIEALNWQTAKRVQDYKWSGEKRVDIVQPGYIIWHGEFHWQNELNLYTALVAAFPQSAGGQGCLGDQLFLAVSEDGVSFRTYPYPFMSMKETKIPIYSLYRATMLYDKARDVMRVWTGLYDDNSRWHVGYFSRKWTETYTALEQARADSGFASTSYQKLLASHPRFGPATAP